MLCFAYVALFAFIACVFADSSITAGDEYMRDPHPFIKIDKKYYLVNSATKMNWFEAELYCRTYGSDLITIESDEEMNALSAHIHAHGYESFSFWTSFTDLAVEGKFSSSSNGRPPAYMRWRKGEPNNAGNDEDCVHVSKGEHILLMNDIGCYQLRYPVCELRKHSNCCGIEKSLKLLNETLVPAYLLEDNTF